MNEKDSQAGFVGCGGGCLGGVLFTITTIALHQLLLPTMLGDGQYGMIIFLTIPVGALMGFISAKLLALESQEPRAAAWLSLICGLSTAVLLIALSIGNASSWFFGPDTPENIRGLFPLLGVPLLWALSLALRGFIKGRK